MSDQLKITLHHPITEEEWDAIADVDFDHTEEVFFHTKHGKEVTFVKQKKGKWDFIGDQLFVCTECGACYSQSQFEYFRTRKSDPEFPYFCPMCGAKMGERRTDE